MTAPRILVVEDEQIVALHLCQQLTSLGYDVPDAVSTGDQALHRIEVSRPDLVLMDINLKGGRDGITTAAAIPAAYRIPVIYLTAYSGDATLERAAATNPYGYLLKPFVERELHAMIQVTLARCRAERVARVALERRRQARKMEALGLLATGMADEVTDLLTTLQGQLEGLGPHETPLTEPIRDAFDEAFERERTLRKLLDFSGRRRPAGAMLSMSDLLADVADRMHRDAGDGIQVQLRIHNDLGQSRIDAGQLTRALLNLADNAREAMPRGGTLTLEGRNVSLDRDDTAGEPRNRYVLLSIADSGVGMTEAVIERAFEPFFTTKPAGCGSGLGLSLVFGFIRQSGGEISIDSKPGGGTTVRLYLPSASGLVETLAAAVDDIAIEADTAWPDPEPGDAEADREPPAARAANHGADWFLTPSGSMKSPDNVSTVLWHRAEAALFASVHGHLGETRYRLIIEPLPRQNGWDWAVWRPGEAEATTRHGRASSVVIAMSAAEGAARDWDRAEPEAGETP